MKKPPENWNGFLFVGGIPGIYENPKEESFQVFDKILRRSNIDRENSYLTYAVDKKPVSNLIENLFTPRKHKLNMPAYEFGYLKGRYVKEITNLLELIHDLQPECIITFGSLALWAVCQKTDVTNLLGKFQISTAGDFKVMPSLNPSYLLRYPAFEEDIIKDLKKVVDNYGLENDFSKDLWQQPLNKILSLKRGLSDFQTDQPIEDDCSIEESFASYSF